MKKYLIAGLLVWLPIWATYVMVKFIIQTMDGIIDLLPTQYHPDTWIGMSIPGIGLVIVFILLLITGLLVTNYLGRKLVNGWDQLISAIPLVRTIHSSVKHLTHAIFSPSTDSFSKVLLVEYPRRGVWSIAFQTNSDLSVSPNDEKTVTVFIPTTPNPTSGFLIIVPQDDIHPFDISVEEAIRMVISLGVITPNGTNKENQNHSLDAGPNKPGKDDKKY